MPKVQFRQIGQANDVRQYLATVLEKRGRPDDLWVFRGQRDRSWDPIPQIDRPDLLAYRQKAKWTRLKQEKWLIEQFQKAARPLTPTPPENTWEWLALGQHHGLATRLLDWTTNSLGALYFACEDQHSTTDSAVWCYHHEGTLANTAADPYSLKQLSFYWPPHVTQRITVQGGCFTTHPAASTRTTVTWPGDLRKVVIPSTSRHRIRRELVQLGITRATLFPDLDGIAVTINRAVAADRPT